MDDDIIASNRLLDFSLPSKIKRRRNILLVLIHDITRINHRLFQIVYLVF